MTDILFKTEDYTFSYRVAGILIRDGKVLLQRPDNETGYAFPGGHVALGETNAQTLIREFAEETGLGITVERLQWVAEIFFPWAGRPCHQICLFYRVEAAGSGEVSQETFMGREKLQGRSFNLEFSWVPLVDLPGIELYPPQAASLLADGTDEVQHFVYRET